MRRHIAVALLLSGCGAQSPQLVTLPAPPPAVVMRGVAVLDVAAGTVTPDRDVLVVGQHVARIAQAGTVEAPDGAVEIDGRGATLLPGLIDMHGHVGHSSAPRFMKRPPDAEGNLRAYLYSGVTTVFDPGDMAPQAFERRAAVASGALPGPRIFTAGPILTAPGGHPAALIEAVAPWWIQWYLVPRVTRQVETPEQGRAAAREIASLGADVVKVVIDDIPDGVPKMSRDVAAAVADEARRAGLRMVAHIGSLQDAVDAAEAGAALWVHGVYKQRLADADIARLAAFRIPMVVTMGVFENYALAGQGPRVPTALERETVPAQVLAAFDDPQAAAVSEAFQSSRDRLRRMRADWRDNVRRLRAAGVTVLAGSDAQTGVFPGPGLHRELALLVETGMTPAEAIRAATLDGARFLANGKEPEFGVVAEGKLADLLLVDGDPTADVAALARIRAVIRNGVPVERTPIGSGP